MSTDKKVDELVKIIWDYCLMHQTLRKADCILCLGSYDLRVPEYASELFLKGFAPLLIFSGSHGSHSYKYFEKPEADIFAEIAVKRGVPKEKILIENKSTNTGENIRFTRALLKENGMNLNTFIVVQKPYMERRSFATFKKVWLEKECIVTSPPLTFEEYVRGGKRPREQVIHAVVRDFIKMKLYAEKGFQIHQEIPPEVWRAYEKLVELGQDGSLLGTL